MEVTAITLFLCMPQASYAKPAREAEGGAKDSQKTISVEEYVGDLLSRIQPAPASEHRRRTIAQYVQDVIAQAFQPAVEANFPSLVSCTHVTNNILLVLEKHRYID